MILNGKALRKFNNWLFKKYIKTHHTLNGIELYAYIIEWYDSVGIYIDAEFFRKNVKNEPQFVGSTIDDVNGLQPLGVYFNSRQEAKRQAIIKANEIYNNR